MVGEPVGRERLALVGFTNVCRNEEMLGEGWTGVLQERRASFDLLDKKMYTHHTLQRERARVVVASARAVSTTQAQIDHRS